VVRHIGNSKDGPDTIRRAAVVHRISDVRVDYSLLWPAPSRRSSQPARELEIGVTAWGVLSRGLLSGRGSPQRVLGAHDLRRFSPRFHGAYLQHNVAPVESLREMARDRQAGPDRLGTGERNHVVVLVGARRRDRLHEALGALDVALGDADVFRSADAVPAGAAAGSATPRSSWSSSTATNRGDSEADRRRARPPPRGRLGAGAERSSPSGRRSSGRAAATAPSPRSRTPG
jgi:aryl-alcohol dehydrogenase-like predicted oxidoreductase